MADDPGDTYWSFISYSWNDTKFARWLHRRLETTPLPRHAAAARSRTVFIDRAEMPAGRALTETLTKALDRSQSLIVILSPHAAASASVDQEIEHFVRRCGADRLAGVLAPGASADIEANKPPAFKRARPENPLLADARRRPEREAALHQLLAFLADVAVDDIAQRARRRRRQAVAVAAGVGTLAVGAGLLTLDAASAARQADAYRRDAAQAPGYEKVRLLVAAHQVSRGPLRTGRAPVEAALRDPFVRLLLAAERADVTRQSPRLTRAYLEHELPPGDGVIGLKPRDGSRQTDWYRLPSPLPSWDVTLPDAPLFRTDNVFRVGRLLVADLSPHHGVDCRFAAVDRASGSRVRVPGLPIREDLRAAARAAEQVFVFNAPKPERIECSSVSATAQALTATLIHYPAGDPGAGGVRLRFAWRPGDDAWRPVAAVDPPPPPGRSLADEPTRNIRLVDERIVVAQELGRPALTFRLADLRSTPTEGVVDGAEIVAWAGPQLVLRLRFAGPFRPGSVARDMVTTVVVVQEGTPGVVLETREEDEEAGRAPPHVVGAWDARTLLVAESQEVDYGGREGRWSLLDIATRKTKPLFTVDEALFGVSYLGGRRFAIESQQGGLESFRVVSTFPDDNVTTDTLVDQFCRVSWWGLQRRVADRYLARPSEERSSRPCG